jgi:thiamine kinase-like enzyme
MSIRGVNDIIQKFLIKNEIKYHSLEIKRIESGLSNILYEVNVDGKLYFLKIYGVLKDYGLIDRQFEDMLIRANAEEGLCARVLENDFETYRIEEYMKFTKTPHDQILFNDEFVDSLTDIIIKYETCLDNCENVSGLVASHNVFNYFKKVMAIVNSSFDTFVNRINSEIRESDKIRKIQAYIDNFYTKLEYLGLDACKLILSHNDIHKGNLTLDDNGKLHGIIDYEYTLYNLIGFDIVNYCVESFFDLEYKEYPYYQIKGNLSELLEDEKYYKLYMLYLNKLHKNGIVTQDEFDKIKTKDYYLRVLGLCSLFWFISATMFINYEDYINTKSFCYVDYSLDRLSIYEMVIKELNSL